MRFENVQDYQLYPSEHWTQLTSISRPMISGIRMWSASTTHLLFKHTAVSFNFFLFSQFHGFTQFTTKLFPLPLNHYLLLHYRILITVTCTKTSSAVQWAAINAHLKFHFSFTCRRVAAISSINDTACTLSDMLA